MKVSGVGVGLRGCLIKPYLIMSYTDSTTLLYWILACFNDIYLKKKSCRMFFYEFYIYLDVSTYFISIGRNKSEIFEGISLEIQYNIT